MQETEEDSDGEEKKRVTRQEARAGVMLESDWLFVDDKSFGE